MSRIRKSFPLPLFRYIYIYIFFFFFFFFCAYHLSIATCPFCCYCLPLASARLVEDVTGKSHHHLHQYFCVVFPQSRPHDHIPRCRFFGAINQERPFPPYFILMRPPQALTGSHKLSQGLTSSHRLSQTLTSSHRLSQALTACYVSHGDDHRSPSIRVKIQNSGKNWFFWFSLLGGEN